ncbi:MAG: site-specific integrase [Clostridiaceae bacterium]
MASYTQLSKYNWKVVVPLGYEDGKRKRVIKQGFKTKKEAEKFAVEVLAKKNRGYIAPTESNVIFKDFINKWFEEHKTNTLGINTRANYKSRIETHIIPKLGSYKLSKITNIMIQDFYNGLINEGLKPSSVKKIMETLNNCFKYAKKNKLIYVIPTDIEKIKAEKPKIEFWTKEEIDYFLDEIKGTYLYDPIFIEVITGLRIGELCGLKWKDINFEDGYLTVNSQVIIDKIEKKLVISDILKTDRSFRRISLPTILLDHLQAIKGKKNDNDFVIPNREGSMCNPRNLSMEFTKKIQKYKDSIEDKKAAKPDKDWSNYMQLKQITFHALRHTHATLLIYNGENIKVVSERLGHKDINTTLDTYAHVMSEMRDNTAALLDNIFKK